MRLLLLYVALFVMRIFGQNTETLRIPNSGDSCNVINLSIGRGEEDAEQIRGPQGRTGKRGSVGPAGSKGDKGQKGEVGPRGITPELSMAEVTFAVLKALAATSCKELMEVHGMSEAGYYQMRTNETNFATYNYCDFKMQNATTCEQLRSTIGSAMKIGYYLLREGDDFVHCTGAGVLPGDCKEVVREGAKISLPSGGVFDIFSESWSREVEVTCDLQTDGGGWTVFQRRFDGSVYFYRNWADYVNGFGNKDGEFWLGLESIYQLTKGGNYELRIDLTDWSGNTVYANYGTFSISSGDDNYRLTVGDYSGTAGNSLSGHNNQQFSTKDADHDTYHGHCAQLYKGAWWFYNCMASNLNGIYNKGPGSGPRTGNGWSGLSYVYLKSTEMKFRRKG